MISVWLTTANKPGGALTRALGLGRGVASPTAGSQCFVQYGFSLFSGHAPRQSTNSAGTRGREEKPSGARVTRLCVHGMPTCVWRFVRKMARVEPDSAPTKTDCKLPSFPLSGECKNLRFARDCASPFIRWGSRVLQKPVNLLFLRKRLRIYPHL